MDSTVTQRVIHRLAAKITTYDRRLAAGGDDEAKAAAMKSEFAAGATCAVLRMPAHDGGWVPVHVTANRVEIDTGTFAGLVSLRLPTPAELAAAGLSG